MSRHSSRDECPYKPGLVCLATVDLAIQSKCLECPRISQCDLLTVWESHRFTTRTVSGRSRGSNPLFVNNQNPNNLPKTPCVFCVCAQDEEPPNYPYDNAYIVLVSKKHIKCISVQELREGKEITPTSHNYLGSRKEFKLDKQMIIAFCDFAVKFFESV